MTADRTDALRRLQALRGLTRTGSAHAVLAAVQGDLQTVIEAVLELAGHDDEHATAEPAVGEQVTDSSGEVWQRFEKGWRLRTRGNRHWSDHPRTWDYVQTYYSPLRATTDDDRRRVGLPVRDENTPPASQNCPQEGAGEAHSDDSGPRLFVAPDPENDDPTVWWGTDLDTAEPVIWRRLEYLADAFNVVAALVEADQAGRVAGPGQVVVDADDVRAALRCLGSIREDDEAEAIDRLRAALERAEGDR